MVDKPRNAASDVGEIFAAKMHHFVTTGGRKPAAEFADLLADDFVQQDRRKLIGVPDMDKAAWIDDAVAFQAETGMQSRQREVVAVRGDRLVLTRMTVRYRDGSLREFLAIADIDGEPARLQRAVLFDCDHFDDAIAELDRLDAGIKAEDE